MREIEECKHVLVKRTVQTGHLKKYAEFTALLIKDSTGVNCYMSSSENPNLTYSFLYTTFWEGVRKYKTDSWNEWYK